MPRFEPFSGLRYSPRHVRSLDDVTCPPYDVVTDEERAQLVGRSPSNIVRLETPRSTGDDDAYATAARLLDAWRDGGILHRDHVPAFYGYRMSFSDDTGKARSTVGVIGALGLEPPGEGIVPHEETTPRDKTDRLELLRATRANLSPIWGLSPAAGLTKLLGSPSHPAERTVCPDGIVHEMWPIVDRYEIDDISDVVGDAPVLIADGHHRYETALAFQAEERDRNGGRPGDHDFVMAFVVELAEEQLAVRAIHRLIAGLPAGFDPLAALAADFELTPTEPPDATIAARMAAADSLAVLTASGAWLARPTSAGMVEHCPDLDASRLDTVVASWPAAEVSYEHRWERCMRAVDSGAADVAVLLRPATIGQIASMGKDGKRMPPKTTLFWPKPRTGLVMRELID